MFPDDRTVTICGIDPGTNHLGICYANVDMSDLSITAVMAETLNADKLNYDCPLYYPSSAMTQGSDRHVKLQLYYQYLSMSFIVNKPSLVIAESPFFNRFRPGSFAPLVETLSIIRNAVSDYNHFVPFITYEPSVIKLAVGATAGANKDKVKVAIESNQLLQQFINQDMDEHSVDALAIVHTHLFYLRNQFYPIK